MTVARTEGTTFTGGVILPPQAVPRPFPCSGPPMGRDLLNNRATVNYDPFALYKKVTSNYNAAFIGDVGNGKSSAMKTFLKRSLTVPVPLSAAEGGGTRLRRAVIVDCKTVRGEGEYARTAAAFGGRATVLGHGRCLNPCDDRLDSRQQLAVLQASLALLLRRDLDPLEQRCAAEAHTMARRAWWARHMAATLTPWVQVGPLELGHVRDALMNLPAGLAAATLRTQAQVDDAAGKLALALDHLLTGALRGVFNGPTTPDLNWAGQVIAISVHPDYQSTGIDLIYQLLVVSVAVWLDRAWQAVDVHQRVDYFVCDEVWDLAKVPQFAQHLQHATKMGRSRGLSVLIAFHGPSDFRSAGHAGEAQVEKAKRLLHDVDAYFLFHMDREEAEVLRPVVGLTDTDVDTITDLVPHQYLLVLGSGSHRRRFFVEHVVTPFEMVMVDTDLVETGA